MIADLQPSEIAQLRELLIGLQGDPWTKATLAAGLPRMVQRESLPTASADWRRAMVLIPGATGAADVLYMCLKSAADSYSWKAVATG